MSISGKKVALSPSTTLVSEILSQTLLDAKLEPYLVVLSGNDKGKHFKLERQRNVFGRSDDADIVIGDPKMSRLHGVLTVYPQRISLEDLQSTNGTFLAGERISHCWLDSQHRFLVGDTMMRIDYKRSGEALSEQNLYRVAYTDGITGALNKGAFLQRAQEEYVFCKRNNRCFTLAICNVDRFKQINDRHGLLAGDLILKEMAGIFAAEIRHEDVLARYGGDEFIMLLRETSEHIAVTWATRVKQLIMQQCFSFQGQSISTTVSLGICSLPLSVVDSLPACIQLVSDAVRVAKQNGRNRVEVAVIK